MAHNPWTQSELEVIVEAYSEAQDRTKQGENVKLTLFLKPLAARLGRTQKACSHQFTHVSCVLVEMGLPWLQNSKPKDDALSKSSKAVIRLIIENQMSS